MEKILRILNRQPGAYCLYLAALAFCYHTLDLIIKNHSDSLVLFGRVLLAFVTTVIIEIFVLELFIIEAKYESSKVREQLLAILAVIAIFNAQSIIEAMTVIVSNVINKILIGG